MYCENCGSQLPDGSKFCGTCGAAQEAVPVGATKAAVETPYTAAPTPPPAYVPPVAQPAYNYAPPQPTGPAYVAQMPTGTEPLTVGNYMGMLLLMCVPILNLVLLFMWSFGGSVNLNKKNFARASLILFIITLVLSIGFGILMGEVMAQMLRTMH